MTPRGDDQDFQRGFKSWCENVALQVRKDLRLDQSAPIDPRQIAENMNIILWRVEEVPGINPKTLKVLTEQDPESWSALTLLSGDKRAIILNSSNSPGRQNSDLAHELAHLLLGHEGSRVDITPDNMLILHNHDKRQEKEANWLAGCLLLPRPTLLHIRKIAMSDAVVLKNYGVSKDMLTFRINVTGVDRQTGRTS